MKNHKKELKVKRFLSHYLDESKIKFFENEYNKLKELEKNKDRVYGKIIDLLERGCLYHANKVIECNYSNDVRPHNSPFLFFFYECNYSHDVSHYFNHGYITERTINNNKELEKELLTSNKIRSHLFQEFKENLRGLILREIDNKNINFYDIYRDNCDIYTDEYNKKILQFFKGEDLVELKKLAFEFKELKNKHKVAKKELEEEEGYEDFYIDYKSCFAQYVEE
jgi:hypothetical protein